MKIKQISSIATSKTRLIGSLALLLAVSLLLTAQEGSPQAVALPGIDVGELARCDNLKLVLPDRVPKVSAETARQTAQAADPFGLPVEGAALAKLLRDGPPELAYRDNLVWAVVLGDGTRRPMDLPRPALGGEGYKPFTYTYALVLVDAVTGQVILEQFGPQDPAYVANICPG